LPPAIAVFERGKLSFCDARLCVDEGIAASCRGFAAFPGMLAGFQMHTWVV